MIKGGLSYMSIRERKSKKHGITYQVYFTYTDIYTNERRFYSKSGFLDYNDAILFEKKKKIELNQEVDHNK